MNDEGGEGRGDSVDGDPRRCGLQPIRAQHRNDQQNRAKGDEDVLTEEGSDIVRRSGMGSDADPLGRVKRPKTRIRCSLGHGRHQRAHHVGLPTQR